MTGLIPSLDGSPFLHHLQPSLACLDPWLTIQKFLTCTASFSHVSPRHSARTLISSRVKHASSHFSLFFFSLLKHLKHFLFLLGQGFCSHSQAVNKTQFLPGQTQRHFGLSLPRFLLKQHGPTLSFSDPQLRPCKRTWPSKGAGWLWSGEGLGSLELKCILFQFCL